MLRARGNETAEEEEQEEEGGVKEEGDLNEGRRGDLRKEGI